MPLTISVIGTGYLGVVHAACMADLGHTVIGVDTDASKIAALSTGQAPLFEPGLDELLARVLPPDASPSRRRSRTPLARMCTSSVSVRLSDRGSTPQTHDMSSLRLLLWPHS